MHKKTMLIMAGFIVAFLMISFGIGEVTRANMGWYDTLVKSPLNPPRFAFPLVWTALYVMLAIVTARLWMARNQDSGQTYLYLIALYMAVNWAWSFIFFAGHMVNLGFAWIIVSDVILAYLIVRLWRGGLIPEAALLIPTLLWGIFAAYLNGYIALVG